MEHKRLYSLLVRFKINAQTYYSILGCIVKNQLTAKNLNIGETYKSHLFTYKCVRENDVLKYKPMSMLCF